MYQHYTNLSNAMEHNTVEHSAMHSAPESTVCELAGYIDAVRCNLGVELHEKVREDLQSQHCWTSPVIEQQCVLLSGSSNAAEYC